MTYLSVLVGMLRARIVAAPIALTNSDAAVAHLLRTITATHVVVSSDPKTQALVQSALAILSRDSAGGRSTVPKIVPIPSFGDLFSDDPVEFLPRHPYNYLTPAIYVHSSGKCDVLGDCPCATKVNH